MNRKNFIKIKAKDVQNFNQGPPEKTSAIATSVPAPGPRPRGVFLPVRSSDLSFSNTV